MTRAPVPCDPPNVLKRDLLGVLAREMIQLCGQLGHSGRAESIRLLLLQLEESEATERARLAADVERGQAFLARTSRIPNAMAYVPWDPNVEGATMGVDVPLEEIRNARAAEPDRVRAESAPPDPAHLGRLRLAFAEMFRRVWSSTLSMTSSTDDVRRAMEEAHQLMIDLADMTSQSGVDAGFHGAADAIRIAYEEAAQRPLKGPTR